MERASDVSTNYADMPREQLNYFRATSGTPVKNPSDLNPQMFIFDNEFSCPHEMKRTSSKPKMGGANQQPDIISKYKQFFSGTNTPAMRSVGRSERSASRMSESVASAALSAHDGVSSVAKPNLTGSHRSGAQTAGASGVSTQGYAPPLQEPQKQSSVGSLRSGASSSKPLPSAPNTGSPLHETPRQAAFKQPAVRHSYNRLDENPIARPPQNFSNLEGDRASVSTCASEPQVVSCQPYDSRNNRAESEMSGYPQNAHKPNPVMQSSSHPKYGQTDEGQLNAARRLPESSMGQPDRGDMGDVFSSRSGSDAGVDDYPYQHMSAAAKVANEPPRRPSYSRMSRSTASVMTVDSAVRDEKPTYTARPSQLHDGARDEQVSDNGGNHSASDHEVYTFKPTINRRSRSIGTRRKDYGQADFDDINGDSANARKGPGRKPKLYSDLDKRSEDIVMPNNHLLQQQDFEEGPNGVFSRLYTDALRYNQDRTERERQIERQRMYERGEISDDELPEKSQETAHPRKSGGRNSDNGEEGDASNPENKKKRHVDFEVFDRLSKPTMMTKKFTQIREEEESERAMAAKKAEHDHIEEMEKIAKYSWDVPAASFRFDDLQRQNALFAS